MRTTRTPKLDRATLDWVFAQFRVEATGWRQMARARPSGRPPRKSGDYQVTATRLAHAEGIEAAIKLVEEGLPAEGGEE